MTRLTGTTGDRARLVALLLGVLLAVAACGGSASSAPTDGPAASDGPVDTAEPTDGPDGSASTGDGTAAFEAATTALDELDSYAFDVEIVTEDASSGTPVATRTLLSGVVINAPVEASLLEQSEEDGDGNVTAASGILVIGEDAWLRTGGEGEAWTPVPAAQAQIFIQSLAAFRPEQLFGIYFAGIGGEFGEVGRESKNGVETIHYQGDEAIGTILGAIAGFQGEWSSDVWIAVDGGYLVRSEARAQAAAGGEAGSFSIVVDISEPNSAGPLEPPE